MASICEISYDIEIIYFFNHINKEISKYIPYIPYILEILKVVPVCLNHAVHSNQNRGSRTYTKATH